MIPIVLLVPAVIEIFEKVVGPLLANKSSLVSKLMSIPSGEGFIGSAIGALESVIGDLKDEKKLELQAELQTLLAQIQIATVDAQSPRFFVAGWRPFICWGIGGCLVYHYALLQILDTLVSLGFDPTYPGPLSTGLLYLSGGILGIYIGARTAEKITSSD